MLRSSFIGASLVCLPLSAGMATAAKAADASDASNIGSAGRYHVRYFYENGEFSDGVGD